MKSALLFLAISCCANARSMAQAIGLYGLADHGAANISLQYQNDAFGKTDYYYSQGVQLAFSLPTPFSVWRKLLPHLDLKDAVYGLAVEHDAYTPTSILSDSILYGDRPYAAGLMLQAYAISVRTARKGRLSGLLSVGVIGPAAGGEAIQTGIHRYTRNDIPHGWQYQISNDLILNYELQYERTLVQAGRFLYLNGTGGASAGTYSDKAFAGLAVRTGGPGYSWLLAGNRSFYCSLEDIGLVELIGYDATLQGGLFNRRSPYIIPAADVRRVTFKNTLGICISIKSCTLTGNFTWLTPEFKTGSSHSWGGMQLAYRFR